MPTTPSDPSLPLSEVVDVLRQRLSSDDNDTLLAIVKDLKQAASEAAAERAANKGPRAKTRFAILIRGDKALKAAVQAGAYVLTVPDPEDDATLASTYMGDGLIGRITTAAKAHNEAPKRRRAAMISLAWRSTSPNVPMQSCQKRVPGRQM